MAWEMAAEEGLVLIEDYWPILYFMREYWLEYRLTCLPCDLDKILLTPFLSGQDS